jgi:hypothetical protein
MPSKHEAIPKDGIASLMGSLTRMDMKAATAIFSAADSTENQAVSLANTSTLGLTFAFSATGIKNTTLIEFIFDLVCM